MKNVDFERVNVTWLSSGTFVLLKFEMIYFSGVIVSKHLTFSKNSDSTYMRLNIHVTQHTSDSTYM